MSARIFTQPLIGNDTISMKKVILFLIFSSLAYIFLSPYYLFPDGQGYFSYLPSLFYDGDIDFYNEFINMRIPVPPALTQAGYISNIWSVGTSLLWSPFYILAKVFAPAGVSPYSGWFWQWTNLGTIFYGIITYLLLVMICKELNLKSKHIWVVPALAFIGTPMFFYTFSIMSTAHGVSAFACALFIWYWFFSLNQYKKKGRYFLLGLLSGFSAMIRPQEAIFSIVVLSELVFRVIKREGDLKSVIKYLGLFCLGGIIGVSPQIILWKFVYGSFFAAPAGFNLSWKYFDIHSVLFSSYHGILMWTPVYLLAFAGLVYGIFRRPEVFTGLTLALAAQVVVNACCVAYWEGFSFGLRQMTSSLPLAAIGLYELLISVNKRPKPVKIFLWALVVISSLWTFGLVAAYYAGFDLLGYVSVSDILKTQMELPHNVLFSVKKIFLDNHTDNLVFLWMLITALIFYSAFAKIKNLVGRKNIVAVSVLVITALTGFDILIIKAHFNRPIYTETRKSVITDAQLGNFFIGQVNEIKNKYSLR